MTLREALRQAEARIASGDIPDARLEAELLLMHCLSLDRAGLYARLREPLSQRWASWRGGWRRGHRARWRTWGPGAAP